jgi:hypothetical protein
MASQIMKDDPEALFARRITRKNADMKLKTSPLHSSFMNEKEFRAF